PAPRRAAARLCLPTGREPVVAAARAQGHRRRIGIKPAALPRLQYRRGPTMEFLVTMTTHVPDRTPEEAVQDIRAREAARSRELAAQGHLLRLWRPPLQPGEWRTLGLFEAHDPLCPGIKLVFTPLR